MPCGGTFPRTQFLGATISQYSASIGWNGAQGELTSVVINDTCNGGGVSYGSNGNGNASVSGGPDSFNPPQLGYPVTFRYSGFRFAGILQNWKEDDTADGPKQYTIRIIDPKDIIDGTQVILNNYIGETFGVPNLLNVFGWLEHNLGAACPEFTASWYPPFGFNVILNYLPAGGFGGADDRGGLPWWQIRLALTYILNVGANVDSFGSNLQYRDHRYNVDLTDLPALDDWVRFSNDSMSLSEIIHEVCELTSHDYFYTLVNHNTIKVNVIDRSLQANDNSAWNVDTAVGVDIDYRLDLGTIGSSVGSATGVTNKSRGVELRQAFTNSFLMGEYRQDLWQTNLMLSDSNSTIWPYWGRDINNNFIVGHGVAYENNPITTEHYFDIPVDGWAIPGLSGLWRVTSTELRFALEGETVWRNFVLARQPALENLIKLSAENKLPAIGTQHFDFMANGITKPLHIESSDQKQAENANREGAHWDWGTKIYENVKQYGELFGKKYMVRLPYLCLKTDSTTPYTLQTNWNIARDGGWFEGAVLGLLPGSALLEHFRQDDGKIVAMVGFQSPYPLDLSNLTNQEDYIQLNPYTAYVKCQVEELIMFGVGDWRAIISLPGVVTVSQPNPDLQQILGLWTLLRMKYGSGTIPDIALFEAGKTIGADRIQYRLHPLPQIPMAAAIPLQSNRLLYGPWAATVGDLSSVTTNTAGKTMYERNADYAPWNFGSVTRMNTAGDAWAISKLSDHYVIEQGTVTVADAPNISLGAALFSGGPPVTRLDTRLSGDRSAITSQYTMKTYTPEYAKLSQQFIASVKRNGMWALKANRMFRKWALEKNKQFLDRVSNFWKQRARWNVRYNTGSSHDLLAGMVMGDIGSAGTKQNIVVNTEMRKLLPELDALRPDSYVNKAVMETTGLLRPFSTKNSSVLPSFENAGSPSGECDQSIMKDHTLFYSREQVPPIVCEEPHLPIVMETLSPFLSGKASVNGLTLADDSVGHDIEYIARDGVYPGHLSVRQPSDNYSSTHWYRGICLRGPLMIAGWGYDIDNKPVPNSSPSYPDNATLKFEDNWLRKPQSWKCGPVDLRWDHRRKVWTAPTPHKLVRVRLQGPALPNFHTPGILEDDDTQFDCDGDQLDSNRVPIFNPYCRPFPPQTIAYCHWDTTREQYYIVHGDDPLYDVNVLTNIPVGSSGLARINGAIGCNSVSTGSSIAFVQSDLDQPLCAGVKIFGYWYNWTATTSEQICGHTCITDCIYYFQPIQAQFKPYIVVTCVDFIECDVSQEDSVSINCTATTSDSDYGSCYCDVDIDCDDITFTDDWKQYKLCVRARRLYLQGAPTEEDSVTLPDGSSCGLAPTGMACDDSTHVDCIDMDCPSSGSDDDGDGDSGSEDGSQDDPNV